MTVLWAIVVILLGVWTYVKGIKKPHNFPPGPPRLPLLGSIPFLKGATTNDKIWNPILEEQYGPVVGLYLGNAPFIMINDPRVIKNPSNQSL